LQVLLKANLGYFYIIPSGCAPLFMDYYACFGLVAKFPEETEGFDG